MKEPIITLQGVSKYYGEVKALDRIDLSIESGAFVTIIGTSGSGKTTLLKTVNGLVGIDKGEVHVYGMPVEDSTLLHLRRKIGYVIQGGGLFPHLSVYENVAFVLHLDSTIEQRTIKERVFEAARAAQLDPSLMGRKIEELSGGQKQRVGIARALAGHAGLILMDEPFGALDDITRRELQREIKSLAETTGVTVLFVTHDIREAVNLGTRMLVMDAGHIVQDGRPEAILASPATAFVKELVEPVLHPIQRSDKECSYAK